VKGEPEVKPMPEAPDPGGAYSDAPGRTGRPAGEGPENPADETVPPPG
jgi:hypothetical protein